jgi:hypothetical protein
MSPRRVLASVLMSMLLAGVTTPRATAQTLAATRAAFDLGPDPTLRNPRLLGMGHLTLPNDVNNGINVWDFALQPVGVLDADSVSTLELRPATAAASGAHDLITGVPGQRQDFGLRDMRVGYEAWRRTDILAYGFIGDISTLKFDQPTSEEFEKRSHFDVPSATVAMNGKIPRISDRWRYALELGYAREQQHDEFRLFLENPTGEYIDNQGTIVPPPDLFTPNDIKSSTLSAGAGLSYAFGSSVTLAARGDFGSSSITSVNEAERHSSQVNEVRPFTSGEITLVGRAGQSFEYGVDAESWHSISEQSWVFTLSTGVAQAPFGGRGKLLEREENGDLLKTRARWHSGALELGAAFNTGKRTLTITPPDPTDPTSFNRFRNTATFVTGADTLAYPDSVSANETEDRARELVVGGTWTLRPRWLVGAEFHDNHHEQEGQLEGKGPTRETWDVRAGMEYPCTSVFVGRVGYIYRKDDLDQDTEQNEFTSNLLTAGLGLHPASTSWTIEAGYEFEWRTPDFGDPTEGRLTRHQAGVQLRWSF